MTKSLNWGWMLKRAALVVAVAAVAVVALPLLAVVAFSLRVVVFAAFGAALVALGLSKTFRAWLQSEAETATSYLGLRMPADELVSPEHTWVRLEERARVTAGVDDLLQKALGPIDGVELPEVDTEVRQGEPLVRLRAAGRVLIARAPVSGRVVRVNQELVDKPQLVNQAPFGVGWTVAIAPAALEHDKRRLRREGPARTWMRGEIDRLLAAVSSAQPVYAMQDGGHVSDDLYKVIDDQAWQGIKAGFFGDR